MNAFKAFPAYGRQMMQLRLAGQVPPNSVVVAFDWDIGKLFPRIILADAVDFVDYELRFLAGLDVTLAYREKDSSRMPSLTEAVLKVEPRILNAFNVDVYKNTILKNSTGEVFL